MKILLAPAESKNEGGNGTPFCKENFCFEDLFSHREFILNEYENHIQQLDLEALSQWFGIKKEQDVIKYSHSLKDKPTMKAIQRYNGVAFDALEYNQLESHAQNYIDDNVILFSNLFGPLMAKDLIPDYKYKQGAKLPNVMVEKYYSDHFTHALDLFLGEEIMDLRAGFYEKFYKATHASVITLKFIKEGKVVSHWAKHYRGKVLKEMAKNGITTVSEFMNMPIEGLKLIEIQQKKNIKLLIMDIV
ncbi:MAG: YaaA family protein [Candidatus Marinarcus sp.]|uniref:YaaA family protein n=1 Tax=Candidatus Marinarcus sp. TaxID=3100987 RepID=UPI003AFFCEEC